MEETLIRGLVMGGVFAVIGATATFLWQVLRSPSEGARRFRQVLLGALALLLGYAIIAGPSADRPFFIVLAFVLGAGVWVYRGMKK